MKVLKRIYGVVASVFVVLEESKKAKALAVGLLLSLFAALKLDLEKEAVAGGLALIGTYMLAQGRADTGKEVAKAKAKADKEAVQMFAETIANADLAKKKEVDPNLN